MNRTWAFVITLLVDFILLFIGAVAIAFLNVVGILVFLIEFYFIKFIHHKVFDFLIKGSEDIVSLPISKNVINGDVSSHFPIIDNSNVLQNPNNNGNLNESKNTNIIEPIIRYARVSKKAIRFSVFSLITLVGFVIIAFTFSNKPNDKKFGGYLYPICENGLYGYIDSVGNKIIEPQYLWGSTFSNNMALVVTDTIFKEVDDSVAYFAGETDSIQKKYRLFAKYGYINRSGDFVLPPKYVCYVNMAKDQTNNDIANCSHAFYQFTYRYGRALVYDTVSWKKGYMDTKGTIVIPQKYYYAKPFSDMLAVVYEKTGEPQYCNNMLVVPGQLRAGYIDVNGDPITDCKFESLTTFQSKRGIGKITEMLSLSGDSIDSYCVHNIIMNEKGEVIDTISMFNRYYDYSRDGIAVGEQIMFIDFDEIARGPVYEYINRNGETLKPLEGLSEAQMAILSKRDDIVQVWPDDVDMVNVTFFENGLAGVSPDNKHWYFIDKYLVVHGNQQDPSFENIQGFGNGLCAVKKNGKWGYVDTKIQEIIPFKYDSCGTVYPYLEESFDLNNDGSINKRYWINRFDSVVWESTDANIVENTYSKKNKNEWGKWSNNNLKNSKASDIRYVYGIITLIMLILAFYIAYKHEFNDKIINKKCVTIPVSICSLLLCLYCAHGILHYLLDDYTKINIKNIQNNTANVRRINSINYKCVRYENERFRSKDSIGTTPQKSHWLKEGIGTLPTGKYISTYVGTNNDRYYAGNREIVRHGRRLVPNYKTVNYGYGIIDKYQDGWKWKEYSYVDYEPVYLDYTWHYAISTFDISDQLSLFCNEDSVYSDYLKSVEEQLTANYGYKFVYTKVNGKKALRYTTYDGTPLKRVIFCANGRAYIMETRSIDKLNEHSETACSKIILKKFNIVDKDNRFISLSILGLLFSITLLILIISWHYKGKIVNKKAHKLYIISIVSAIINVILFCGAIHAMYIRFEISIFIAYTLILSFSSCFIVSIPLVAYYRFKEKSDKTNCIIPFWTNKLVYSKISSETCRKVFMTFVTYPLMIISLIPCGVVTLAYTIPALLGSIIILLLSKWYIWLVGNTEHVGSVDITFKDYYSILNVPSNANQNEINIAYNSKMAFLNLFVNTKSCNKTEYQDVQEAYRILSTPHLKSIYDTEYVMISKNGDIKGCSFTNKEIINYIQDIRKNTIINSSRTDKFNKIFFFFVFVVTTIVFIVRCSSDSNEHNSTGRGFSHNYNLNRFNTSINGYGSTGDENWEDEDEEEYEEDEDHEEDEEYNEF